MRKPSLMAQQLKSIILPNITATLEYYPEWMHSGNLSWLKLNNLCSSFGITYMCMHGKHKKNNSGVSAEHILHTNFH